MTVFITLAHLVSAAPLLAQQAGNSSQADSGGDGLGRLLGSGMIMPVLLIVLMFFVMIRPQRQQAKEKDKLQKSLQPGDEVVTVGGAHGVITTIHEKTVVVRMVEGKIEFDRSAITVRTPKVSETEKV